MEKRLFIKSYNNLYLSAVIHKPGGKGKFPAVVLLHGFTGYKDEEHIVELSKALAKNSIVAVRFDTSGYGESEGNIEDNYRLTNFYKDIQSVFEYAKSMDYVNTDRLGIWGQSLGGTMAIIFAANNSFIQSVCVVSSPTVFARKDNFERRTKAWKETGYFEKDSTKYGHIKIPYAFVVDSQKWNSIEHIQKIRKPTLFIAGAEDVNVFPENTKVIFDLANEPKQFILIPKMGHDYKKIPEQINKVNELTVKFFENNLRI